MSVLRVSSSSFRKTLNISYRKKNLIFLLSRILSFACILRVSTMIITLLIITMFLSTCRSSQQTFSNKQNRVQFRVFYNFQVSVLVFGYAGGKGRCFSKTLAGSGVQQKQFQRILKSRHYCFHSKAFANFYEKRHKQISTT